MARCIRGGNSYKRHKVVNGACKHCGGILVSDEKREEMIEQVARQLRDAEFGAIMRVIAQNEARLSKESNG